MGILQLVNKMSAGIEDVDMAIAEIADQDHSTEAAEGEGRPRDAPRRIERPTAGEAAQQMPVGIEHIDEAVPRSRHVIVFLSVLFRVGDEQLTVDFFDVKRCETRWDIR